MSLDVQKRFGIRLRYLREQRHLTQLDLSAKTDIDESNIRKYEKGKVNLKLTTLERLAAGLEITLGELLNFDNENNI